MGPGENLNRNSHKILIISVTINIGERHWYLCNVITLILEKISYIPLKCSKMKRYLQILTMKKMVLCLLLYVYSLDKTWPTVEILHFKIPENTLQKRLNCFMNSS